MPTAFTDEEIKSIRSELIQAGIRISKELGLQRMSVEKLTEAVGIASRHFSRSLCIFHKKVRSRTNKMH